MGTLLRLADTDVRKKNYNTALRLFVQQLIKLNNPSVSNLIKKWKVTIIEGERPCVGIEFPDDLTRLQWFVDIEGNPYIDYVESTPEKKK